MKILLVTSTATPFTGDCMNAKTVQYMCRNLRKKDVDIRVMMPNYSWIPKQYQKKMSKNTGIIVPLAWRNQYCDIEELRYDKVPYYFVTNDQYFNKESIDGFDDDAERFAFFCRAVLESLPSIDFQPDIIHCHDWHTGMLSVFLKSHYAHSPFYKDIHTLFTIYDLKNQGVFSKDILSDLLDLDEEYFNIDGIEFYDKINYLKSGIAFSDMLTTVSQSYAEEIQTPEFGEGLDGILKKRKDKLVGIMNGLDYNIYNPAADSHIFITYHRSMKKKMQNKSKLQASLNLPQNTEIPLISVISPLTIAKGLDRIAFNLEKLISKDIQIVVLGEGDEKFESLLREFAAKYPENMAVVIAENDPLMHKIYAGSDMLLSPPYLEPYTTNVLAALRYGTIPIASETGCLKDVINVFDKNNKKGNGFTFSPLNLESMMDTLDTAIEYYKDKDTWMTLFKNALKTEFNWETTTNNYYDLYLSLLS